MPAGWPSLASCHGVPRRSRCSSTWARPASVSANALPCSPRRGRDEPLVLELGERGVDRAGARAPGAGAALLDLLHEAVAVARLLLEQEQDRGADVAASAGARGAGRRAGPSRPSPRARRRGGRGARDADGIVVSVCVCVSHAVSFRRLS